MEFGVTWAELGFTTAGAPFSFHVSSSNASLGAASWPAQVDDNLGGCGGGAGGTQFAAVSFAPDVALSGSHGVVVLAAHALTNDGNGTDTFNLTPVVSGAHTPTVTLYADADASGTLTPGDTLLVDTDGDSAVDTGPLLSGASFDLLIAYQIAANAPWDPAGIATIVTTASSSFAPSVQVAVTDTVDALIVPELMVMKSVATVSDPFNGTTDPKAIPGSTVGYTVTVTNLGGGAVDPDTVVLLDAVPANSDLFVGDIGPPGSGPMQFVDGAIASGLGYTFVGLGSAGDDVDFSNDGGTTYTYTPIPDASGFDANVTHIRVLPEGSLAPSTQLTDPDSPSFSLQYQIRVH
jgi:uncharacterized repeat protein (TIGR01451 family)